MIDNHVDTLYMCMWTDVLYILTAAGLQADLQAQVVHWAHHPQVAGGSDVELQPAFVSCPQPARVQQEQVFLPGELWIISSGNIWNGVKLVDLATV